jgi:hypothetical protein
MATATRGDEEEGVEIIPKGMFASEKCDPRGMLNQDRSEVIVSAVMIPSSFF